MSLNTNSTPSTSSSLAATLPPDLLDCIAAHAFEDSCVAERQQERFSYSQVCRSWYCALSTNNKYCIAGPSQAGSLAELLETQARGDLIQQLDIEYDAELLDWRQHIKLLDRCVNLATLHFWIPAPSPNRPVVLRPINDHWLLALQRRVSIRSFKISNLLDREFESNWWPSSVEALLSSWPKLQSVQLDKVHLHVEDSYIPVEYTLPALQSFRLDSNDGGCSETIINIVYNGRFTLKSLHLNGVISLDKWTAQRFLTAVNEAAPNLTNLVVLQLDLKEPLLSETPNFFDISGSPESFPRLQKLVVELDLVDRSTVFDSLSRLVALVSVELLDWDDATKAARRNYNDRPQIRHFARLITQSSTLRRIQLHAGNRSSHWFAEQGDDSRAKEAAQEGNVPLSLLFGDDSPWGL